MLSELKIIRNVLVRLVAGFVLGTAVFLFMPLPLVGGATLATWAVGVVEAQFVPAGATLAVFGPLDAFFAQASLAAMLALLALVPVAMVELWRFAAPALTARERGGLAGGLMLSLILSALGAVFAYTVLVPVMFNELLYFIPSGVEAVFGLQRVVSLVAGFTLGTALIFLLPLLMALLSYIGLVPATLWGAYVRPAVLLVLIASAIITPDGSGVGMILLSLPVCALYGLGYAGAQLSSRSLITNTTNN